MKRTNPLLRSALLLIAVLWLFAPAAAIAQATPRGLYQPQFADAPEVYIPGFRTNFSLIDSWLLPDPGTALNKVPISTGSHGWTVGTPAARIPGAYLTIGAAYYMGAFGLALAEANTLSTLPAVCIADTAASCMTSGVFQFPASRGFAPGAPVYVSDTVAGGLIQSTPAPGHYLQAIGTATAADTIAVQPTPLIGGLN